MQQLFDSGRYAQDILDKKSNTLTKLSTKQHELERFEAELMVLNQEKINSKNTIERVESSMEVSKDIQKELESVENYQYLINSFMEEARAKRAKQLSKKTSEVIKKCFEELIISKIDLTGVILKPNMILDGSGVTQKIDGEQVAQLTLKCLKESVPEEVPGIAFLSGGQGEIEATENLNLINKSNNTKFIMTYSYGRALQQSALKYWAKDINDISGTQKTFNHRANLCSLAAQGKWSKDLEIQS